DARSVWFGPARSKRPFAPLLSWFTERTSAPAWKWQLAQATRPSLPTCVSQNRALPSATAAARFMTKSPRFGGSGTATVLREGGGPAGGCGGTCARAGPARATASRTRETGPGDTRDMGTSAPQAHRPAATRGTRRREVQRGGTRLAPCADGG